MTSACGGVFGTSLPEEASTTLNELVREGRLSTPPFTGVYEITEVQRATTSVYDEMFCVTFSSPGMPVGDNPDYGNFRHAFVWRNGGRWTAIYVSYQEEWLNVSCKDWQGE